MKNRIVVLGASGFVGSSLIQALSQAAYEIIPVFRKDCDFTAEASRDILGNIIQDGDIVVCAAAKAPAKNWDMVVENVSMITHIVEVLRKKTLSYVLNISSDAVYADSMDKLTESSLIAPLAAHGMMHCMREYILEKNVAAPIGHVRPTLIYGENDPHNGYGPNSFIRAARTQQKIELFGGGEEQRDHIYVGDVAALACAMIAQKTTGAINAVSGKTISFNEIAQLIKGCAKAVEIASKPRSGPMPHNGYRAFSNQAAMMLSPGLKYQDMARYIQRMMEK